MEEIYQEERSQSPLTTGIFGIKSQSMVQNIFTPIQGMKHCLKCNEDHPLDAFPSDKSRKDGKHPYCQKHHRKRLNAYENSEIGRAKKKKRRDRWQRTILGRHWCLRGLAKRRKLFCNISLEDYTKIVMNAVCVYCGWNLPATGHGLDRIEAKSGYTIENVVPCCDWCNVAKSDHLSFEEMKNFVGPAIRRVREGRAVKIPSMPIKMA